MSFCPNCVELKGYVYLPLFVNMNEFFVSKLKKVCLKYIDNDIEVIKTFAKNFGNTIKSVKMSGSVFENTVTVLMQEFLNLKSLEELKLSLHPNEENEKSFDNKLKAIGIECKQLKSFDVYISYRNATLGYHLSN